MYSLMGGFYTSLPHLADSMTYVNTDWLKAIGRPMPDTIVEFRDMLRAFKSQNPGLPGSPSERIPLNFCNAVWNAGIQYLAGSWGIQGNYNLNSGKITGTVNTQNYREYLEFLNGLVSEGLVNVEGFSQNREQYASQISAMRVGVFLGWAPTVFIPVAANHPMWDVIPPLAVPGKENLRIFHGASTARSQSSRSGFLITRQSKHPEAAMRWWDYLSTDQDQAMLNVHGVPGIGYYKRGNEFIQIQPTDEQARQFGLVTANDYFPSIGMLNSHPVVLKYPATDQERSPYTENAWRERAVPKYWSYMPTEWIPRSLASPDKVEERSLIELDLLPFINTFRADAILNGVTDAKWNAYINDLNNRYRYNDYLKWHQDYCDGKF
jgi:putative aldouronate transport system substrate-binding protein